MDEDDKIRKAIEDLFEETCTTDITVESRDEYRQKKQLLESLRDQ